MLDLSFQKTYHEFSLDITSRSEARVLGVVGPSGSGKSTLLNCIAGVTAPDSGSISVNGRKFFDTSSGHVSLPIRDRRIGYVLQSGLLFPHLSVTSNLQYGHRAHGACPDFDAVIDVLGLRSLLTRRAANLSGGEARRVAIGRAILTGPDLLLLDEPLAGLDPRMAHRTLGFLGDVLQTFEIPAILVSHSISDVLFLCDDAWALDHGSLVATGTPREVIRRGAGMADPATSDLVNFFPASLVGRDTDQPTTYSIGDQSLVVASAPTPAPQHALLSVHASDIILARTHPQRISARNILRGTITDISQHGTNVLAFVDVGYEWMVRLTRDAVDDLELTPGVEVFAILKASSISVAVRHTVI